jgi:ribulose-phosphate 3-epimerase
MDLKKEKPALIAASLLSADVLNMQSSIEELCGEEDWLHLDIMDGHFVPNLSYGPSLLKALRKEYKDAFIDVHIMVEPAENFIDMFLAEKPSLLTVHLEATMHIHKVLQKIRKSGCLAGVSISPGTAPELLCPVLKMTDLVLIMSVNPGYGGQSFIPEVLDKVEFLAQYRNENNLNFLIEMDGGLGPHNIKEVVAKGCDVVVAGNAIFGQPNPSEVIRIMKNKVGDLCV